MVKTQTTEIFQTTSFLHAPSLNDKYIFRFLYSLFHICIVYPSLRYLKSDINFDQQLPQSNINFDQQLPQYHITGMWYVLDSIFFSTVKTFLWRRGGKREWLLIPSSNI